MSRNRSQKAGYYGRLVERKARERYGLRSDHGADEGVRIDARGPNGRPWEIKGVLLTRADPHFRLWEDQHEYLKDHGGGYVFAAYRPAGRGIQIDRFRSVAADNLELSFYGAGHHRRGEKQAKIVPSRIFPDLGQ